MRRHVDDLVRRFHKGPANVGAVRTSQSRDQEAATDHQGYEVKGGQSPTLHQFQFRGSRHVRVMEWEVVLNIGAERAAAGPDRISLTQLPALPTRMHRFFCRQRYTNLVDGMHHDNCAWIIGRRSRPAAAKLLS